MSEKKRVTLNSVCRELSDGLHKAPIFNHHGEYLFVNAKNLEDGYIIDDCDGKRADYTEYKKYGIELDNNTILYSIDGSIGKIAKFRGEKCILGKGACYLKIKDDVNCDYIYYLLQSSFFSEYIRLMSTGSTIHHISLDTMRNFIFDLPKRNIQDKIAFILSQIDNKIHLNHIIINKLENISKTIYNYYFFQFDFPDAQGRPYRASGGKMVYNKELDREIPEGWKAAQISDLGAVITGGTPSTKHPEYFTQQGHAWITPKDMSLLDGKYISHGATDITDLGLKKSSAQIMPAGSVVYTTRAPIGYIAIAGNDVSTNQGFKSIIPKKEIGQEFVYYTLISLEKQIKRVGCGSTFSEVSKEQFSSIKIVLPPDDILEKFSNIIVSSSQLQMNKQRENKYLKSLRDFLLPLLMNGQVQFKE